MKKHFGSLAGLCVLIAGLSFAGSNIAAAQQPASGVNAPPKVLVIQREFLKPGKGGSLHQKSESAFVQAFAEAKWPEHYMALNALSGKSRVLFFVGYDSFEDWQKDNEAIRKNATLAAAIDSAQAADGELLDSYESSAFLFRDDLSFHAPVDIAHMRYMEITVFRIRPGHRHDFETLAKMSMDAYQKANIPNAHWAAFEDMYGVNSGDKYIVITPMKSLAEVDQEIGSDKQYAAAMGADQMKKMADLSASTIESVEANLFMINPKMSYAPDSWKSADPEFWGQK